MPASLKFVDGGARVTILRYGSARLSSDIHQISTERERQSDLDFAGKAVDYLGKKGLTSEEVIDYLVEEFNLDRDTARALATRAA